MTANQLFLGGCNMNNTKLNVCDFGNLNLPDAKEILSGFRELDLTVIFSSDYKIILQEFINSLPNADEIVSICMKRF